VTYFSSRRQATLDLIAKLSNIEQRQTFYLAYGDSQVTRNWRFPKPLPKAPPLSSGGVFFLGAVSRLRSPYRWRKNRDFTNNPVATELA
jgi:hypothetical protein